MNPLGVLICWFQSIGARLCGQHDNITVDRPCWMPLSLSNGGIINVYYVIIVGWNSQRHSKYIILIA